MLGFTFPPWLYMYMYVLKGMYIYEALPPLHRPLISDVDMGCGTLGEDGPITALPVYTPGANTLITSVLIYASVTVIVVCGV